MIQAKWEVAMLLNGKTAIIFGAAGANGSAVAKAFAREGARVFLSGRNGAPVEVVANDSIAVGGVAETATVDALDETAIERYVAEVAGKSGGIDVMLNAIGFRAVQGVPLSDLAPKDFAFPIAPGRPPSF
jgi:3-oxoacyl-[acyl-carrier protein] reductase